MEPHLLNHRVFAGTGAASGLGAWLSLALALLGCAPGEGAPISRSALLDQINSGSAPTIVDVRSRIEYEKGHVPGAVHIQFWAAFGQSSRIKASPGGPIVVYCEHGPRASIAKMMFRRAGLKDVRSLKGHMSGWRKAGLPVALGSAAGGPPSRPES